MTGDMKKMTIVIVVMLVMAVFMPTHAFAGSKDSVEVDLLDISEMPKTAVRQENAHSSMPYMSMWISLQAVRARWMM